MKEYFKMKQLEIKFKGHEDVEHLSISFNGVHSNVDNKVVHPYRGWQLYSFRKTMPFLFECQYQIDNTLK